MKKQILIIASLTLLSLTGIAQVKVFSNRNFGVKRTEAPSTSFWVNGNSVFCSSATGTGQQSSALIRGNIIYSSDTTPDFTWWNNDRTGIFHPNPNIIGITVDGNERMRIHSNGNIGIGDEAPASMLSVGSGSKFQVTSSGYVRSISGSATYPTYSFTGSIYTGLYSSGSNTLNFTTNGTERMRIASNGYVGIGNSAPSYLLTVWGNAYCNGQWLPSDANFKENITSIDSPIEKLMLISGKKYEYNTDEFPQMNFDEGFTYGVIAQELQAAIPELVKSDSAGNLAVNYNGIIPFLIEAVKAQQQQIETLQQNLAICCTANTNKTQSNNDKSSPIQEKASSTEIAKTDNNSYLLQNRPNPFTGETTIDYFVAESITNASIMIFDLNGKLLKTIILSTKGKGSVTIQSYELTPGMYYYSLVVNGNEADTKKMIVAE
jgi:hypothetical protein